MSDDALPTIDSPPAETSSSVVWAVSLAFWITLLVAALMYGTVALAPRLYAWMQVRHEFMTNAHQLQALESEVDYLERVDHALETDPAFVRRMASTAIGADADQTEVIPVSGSLVFGSSDQLQSRLPDVEQPWAADLVQRLAADRQLRTLLLTTACVMVVFAFTVLNGTGGRFVQCVSCVAVAAVQLPLNRYRRADRVHGADAPEDDPDDDEE